MPGVLQGNAQQTPPTQFPVAHSVAVVQGPVFSFRHCSPTAM
jgi:hypothetical protein